MQVNVAHLVSIDIVHLLKFVQVDINQAEDAGGLPRCLDDEIEILLQGEAVLDAGEKIEFRPVRSE